MMQVACTLDKLDPEKQWKEQKYTLIYQWVLKVIQVLCIPKSEISWMPCLNTFCYWDVFTLGSWVTLMFWCIKW